MHRIFPIVLWTVIALVGTVAIATLALARGETISAAWLVVAAGCTWAIAYRFHSLIISRRIFTLDDRRTTPAVRHDDGHDFVPTDRWVAFGHHFAAIAGAGPLVGPILAAQFGWLPGTLWIVVGVVLAGAVQDLVILCASIRRDGKSLGQMALEEIGPVAGWAALLGTLAIVLLLIAVLAIVVVGATAKSPWSVVTVGLTIPIALLMGVWMRWIRPGRTLEASLIGLGLLAVAMWLGQVAAHDPVWAERFTWKPVTVAWAIIGYGFVAAILPVWMLLAPRDYLSAFVKIGVVGLLAAGVLLVLPALHMPALVGVLADGTDVAGGHGPVFAGSLFPFAFITIACGAVSGFHALVSSGTTPKMIARESDCRMIGYGGMLMEASVALMALIAACALTPGLFFAMNSGQFAGKDAATVAAQVTSWGFALSAADLTQAAKDVGEPTIIARTGGAATLAVGMAHLFDSVTRWIGWESMKAWWYHFAILFEVLFILTTVDAGTRVARFMLQNVAAPFHPRLGQVSWWPASLTAAALVVAGWGGLLLTGVLDPAGVKFLWPVFGIANQTLAAIALCVGTTVIISMGKARWAWITALPLAWLMLVTQWAAWQRLFSPDPQLGFLAQIDAFSAKLALVTAANAPASAEAIRNLERSLFNARLDAVLVVVFVVVAWVVLLDSCRRWWRLLRNGPAAAAPIPDLSDPAPGRPLRGILQRVRAWADDDAYERHCASHAGHRHELPTRAEFMRERIDRRAGRPRCC